mmetsp:Transcript_25638/g.64629  ORF Transcript_25638/g.64629 Transcript_25638/m.64629 type:complete len:522 (+) Transcript_25638:64-1629(+)
MSGSEGGGGGPASLQTHQSHALPKKVGPADFERVKLIGQGDVGKVYLVRLKNTKHLFAMKVLSKQEMIARNKLKRCLTEREILATVDYPFIVTLYYCFQSPDHLFLVMDYCAGGEFFRMLKSQPDRRIPEEWVRFYAAEVLLALEYLHNCGFIYRDLKPENILLHDTGHIMLTDFDLSKQAAVTAPVVKQSFFSNLLGSRASGGTGHIVIDTNSFVGTEEYIAPEVIKGSGQSSAVDWWTFGILIYEMAYGFTPFKGDTQHATFSNICGSDRIAIPEKPDLSSGFKKMIRGLLARDPGKRLGSKHGAAELKKCEFLQEVKWTTIRNQKPPYIPAVVDPLEQRPGGLRDAPDAALDTCLAWAPEVHGGRTSSSASATPKQAPPAAASKKEEAPAAAAAGAGGEAHKAAPPPAAGAAAQEKEEKKVEKKEEKKEEEKVEEVVAKKEDQKEEKAEEKKEETQAAETQAGEEGKEQAAERPKEEAAVGGNEATEPESSVKEVGKGDEEEAGAKGGGDEPPKEGSE